MTDFNALDPPPVALQQGGAEIVRGAIVEGALHISLRRAFDDPQMWGLVLADIARHVARIYRTEDNTPEERTLERVRDMFDAEMDAPTDPGSTRAVS